MSADQRDRSVHHHPHQPAGAHSRPVSAWLAVVAWVREHRGMALGATLAGLLGIIVVLSVLGGGGATPASSAPPRGKDRVEVQVLNAAGERNLALRVTEFLRHEGFDVVELGNAEMPRSATTVVIDRCGDPSAARRVAAALGVDPAQVVSKPDPGLYLDVTVVLGRDFRKLTPME